MTRGAAPGLMNREESRLPAPLAPLADARSNRRQRLLAWAVLLLLLLLLLRLARTVFVRRREPLFELPLRPPTYAPPREAVLRSATPEEKPTSAPEVTTTGQQGRTPRDTDRPGQQEASPRPVRQRRRAKRPSPWWRRADRLLLAVEIGAVLFFVVAGLGVWLTLQDLNNSFRVLHQADPEVLPTVMSAANPGSIDLRLSLAPLAEAPAQLLPASGAMAAPPLPTPPPTVTPPVPQLAAAPGLPTAAPTAAPDYARRIRIPAIDVDSYVFQSTDPRALKLGVAQFGYLTAPGRPGNLVLAAHNDIYGEIFRYLGDLELGDEVTLYGDRLMHTYRVRDKLIVNPEEVWVMLPTSSSTLTLITCYPYLIDSERLVVFADLVE